MANELKDNAYCGKCKFFQKTESLLSGFCRKRKITTKDKAVCGQFNDIF